MVGYAFCNTCTEADLWAIYTSFHYPRRQQKTQRKPPTVDIATHREQQLVSQARSHTKDEPDRLATTKCPGQPRGHIVTGTTNRTQHYIVSLTSKHGPKIRVTSTGDECLRQPQSSPPPPSSSYRQGSFGSPASSASSCAAGC